MTNMIRAGFILAAIGSLAGIGTGGPALSASPGDASAGKSLFSSLCARCHGADGKGEGYTKFTPPVADLTDPAIQRQLDATLFKRIHDGKADTAMGAWKMALTEEQIADVVAYVRLLGGNRESGKP